MKGREREKKEREIEIKIFCFFAHIAKNKIKNIGYISDFFFLFYFYFRLLVLEIGLR